MSWQYKVKLRNKVSTGKPNVSLRRALDAALRDAGREPITDNEWGVLVSREYARHFEEGEPGTLNDALAFVGDARLMRGNPRADRKKRDPGADIDRKEPSPRAWHDRALSELFASYAIEHDGRQRFGIARFRERALGGRVLPRDQAGPWVVEQSKKEGHTVITIPSPQGDGYRVEMLDYGIEGDEWAHHVAVASGGLLDDLRKVSKLLQEFFGWMPAQASFFVLTGSTPWVSSLRSTVQGKWPLRARERIVLSIHPTCTPREVADFFADVRQEHYGRLRRLSPKHSILAAFYGGLPDGLRPTEMVRRWNAECARRRWAREWTYKANDADLFHRDAKTALRRLAELGGQDLSKLLPPGVKLVKRKKASRV